MTVHFESLQKSGSEHVRVDLGGNGAKASSYEKFGKRLFEGALILAAAPIFVPVMVVVTIALLLSGQKPFYLQKRVGKGGELFTIFKFRTMVENAEDALKTYLSENPDAAAEWEATQKLKDDPRITTVGRFLRKTSLDELPQLLNVLLGDMSLVGPRPMMPDQRSLYPGAAYYSMRPGITGAWQVSERNDSEFRSRADYDAKYHSELSFGTDMSILGRTVGVVVRGTGY